MIKAVQDVTGGAGSNLFLFNDIGQIAEEDPVVADWISGRGEAARLID